MDTENMTPREQLLIAIRRAGMTQAQAAEKMQLREQDLSGIITGRINPTEAERKRIAKAFGITDGSWKL